MMCAHERQQLAQVTESSRNVSQAARGLHEGRNAGFKTCNAFYGAQEQVWLHVLPRSPDFRLGRRDLLLFRVPFSIRGGLCA